MDIEYDDNEIVDAMPYDLGDLASRKEYYDFEELVRKLS